MSAFDYTVVSFHYKNKNPRKLVATTRKVMRPTQRLVNPVLRYFGLGYQDVLAIHALDVGETHVDKFGDYWKKIE